MGFGKPPGRCFSVFHALLRASSAKKPGLLWRTEGRKPLDGRRESGYLWLEVGMKKKYWSNVFAMLGVALVATALFRDNWFWGTALGVYCLFWGAQWYMEA